MPWFTKKRGEGNKFWMEKRKSLSCIVAVFRSCSQTIMIIDPSTVQIMGVFFHHHHHHHHHHHWDFNVYRLIAVPLPVLHSACESIWTYFTILELQQNITTYDYPTSHHTTPIFIYIRSTIKKSSPNPSRSCQTIIFTNLENIKTLKQLYTQKDQTNQNKSLLYTPCPQVRIGFSSFPRFPCNSPLFAEILWSQPPRWQEQEPQLPTLPTAPAVAPRPRAAASHCMWSPRAEPPECRFIGDFSLRRCYQQNQVN